MNKDLLEQLEDIHSHFEEYVAMCDYQDGFKKYITDIFRANQDSLDSLDTIEDYIVKFIFHNHRLTMILYNNDDFKRVIGEIVEIIKYFTQKDKPNLIIESTNINQLIAKLDTLIINKVAKDITYDMVDVVRFDTSVVGEFLTRLLEHLHAEYKDCLIFGDTGIDMNYLILIRDFYTYIERIDKSD